MFVLVTGASYGVGKGIALTLGDAGATVFVTGRSDALLETARLVDERGGHGVPIRCDHTDDEQVRAVFSRIEAEAGTLDVLVNNVWAGYAGFHEGRFAEMSAPFWEKPLEFYDANLSSVRAHFTSTALAVPLLRPGSLVVTISYFVGRYPRAVDDVAYTMAKAADDRLMLAAAAALREREVACVSLWPGLVATELVLRDAEAAGFDLSRAETPEFTGRVIAALAADPDKARLSGVAMPVAELAEHYGVTDVAGNRPESLRGEFVRDCL
jgi:NAD(P)-dependent dehydrogenase (short-subunit alcohol dehydrogenase family)